MYSKYKLKRYYVKLLVAYNTITQCAFQNLGVDLTTNQLAAHKVPLFPTEEAPDFTQTQSRILKYANAAPRAGKLFTSLELHAMPNVDSVKVSWEIAPRFIPDELNLSIVYLYTHVGDCARLDLDPTAFTEIHINGRVRSYVLINIRPWATIKVVIIGVVLDQPEENLISKSIITHEITPTAPPHHLKVIYLRSDSAHLTWSPPNCTARGGLSHGYDVNVTGLEAKESDSAKRIKTKTNSVNLKGLRAFSRYRAMVRYSNSKGESNYSQPLEFRTSEAPPGPPLIYNFTYEHSRIGLILVPPNEPNGILTEFELKIQTGKGAANIMHGLFNTNKFMVENLKTNTKYLLWARVKNSAGLGPWSNVLTVMTKATAAPRVQHLRQTFANKTCIAVAWSTPAHGSGVVRAYRLKIKQRMGDLHLWDKRLGQSEFSHLLCGLDSYTEHIVEVAVETDFGSVGTPELISVWTEGMSPPKPPSPVIVETMVTSVTIRLTPVNFVDGPISGYEIRLRNIKHKHTGLHNADEWDFNGILRTTPDAQPKLRPIDISRNGSLVTTKRPKSSKSLNSRTTTSRSQHNTKPDDYFLNSTAPSSVPQKSSNKISNDTLKPKSNSQQRKKRSHESLPGVIWLELEPSDLKQETTFVIGDGQVFRGKRNEPLKPGNEYAIILVVKSTVVDVTKHAYSYAKTTVVTKSATKTRTKTVAKTGDKKEKKKGGKKEYTNLDKKDKEDKYNKTGKEETKPEEEEKTTEKSEEEKSEEEKSKEEKSEKSEKEKSEEGKSEKEKSENEKSEEEKSEKEKSEEEDIKTSETEIQDKEPFCSRTCVILLSTLIPSSVFLLVIGTLLCRCLIRRFSINGSWFTTGDDSGDDRNHAMNNSIGEDDDKDVYTHDYYEPTTSGNRKTLNACSVESYFNRTRNLNEARYITSLRHSLMYADSPPGYNESMDITNNCNNNCVSSFINDCTPYNQSSVQASQLCSNLNTNKKSGNCLLGGHNGDVTVLVEQLMDSCLCQYIEPPRVPHAVHRNSPSTQRLTFTSLSPIPGQAAVGSRAPVFQCSTPQRPFVLCDTFQLPGTLTKLSAQSLELPVGGDYTTAEYDLKAGEQCSTQEARNASWESIKDLWPMPTANIDRLLLDQNINNNNNGDGDNNYHNNNSDGDNNNKPADSVCFQPVSKESCLVQKFGLSDVSVSGSDQCKRVPRYQDRSKSRGQKISKLRNVENDESYDESEEGKKEYHNKSLKIHPKAQEKTFISDTYRKNISDESINSKKIKKEVTFCFSDKAKNKHTNNQHEFVPYYRSRSKNGNSLMNLLKRQHVKKNKNTTHSESESSLSDSASDSDLTDTDMSEQQKQQC